MQPESEYLSRKSVIDKSEVSDLLPLEVSIFAAGNVLFPENL